MASTLTRTPSVTPSDTPDWSGPGSSSSRPMPPPPHLEQGRPIRPIRPLPRTASGAAQAQSMQMLPPPPPHPAPAAYPSTSDSNTFSPYASTSSFGSRLPAPIPVHPPTASSSRSDVIDLTSSSPPTRPRHLSSRFPHLALPGTSASAPPGPNTSNAIHGPPTFSSARRNPNRRASAANGALLLSSDDDDDDAGAYQPVAGPSTGTGTRRTRAAARALAAAGDDSDDSDIVIVSEGPTRPTSSASASRVNIRPSTAARFARQPASPPPFVVPPRSTATTAGGAAGPSYSTRSRRAATTSTSASASDQAEARRLAAQYAAEEGASGLNDYIAAQARAFEGARDSPRDFGFGGPPRIGGRGGEGGGGGGGGGIFAGLDRLMAMSPEGFSPGSLFATLYGLGASGGWGGGGGGGLQGLYAGAPAGATGGWGGAAKVKAATKKYGVRMSHPGPVERGFARDIVEPGGDPDVDAPAVAKKARKGKGKGRAQLEQPAEELVPVCAACLAPLILGGEGDQKVMALCCGHVVCKKCLGEARARCEEIRAAEKGRWVMDVDGEDERGGGGGRRRQARKGNGKGKGKAVWTLLEDDSDPDDLYAAAAADSADSESSSDFASSAAAGAAPRRLPPVPTSKSKAKAKGKSRSRADETGVEENWTTCPVATCDGRGSDLLASEGWGRVFELYA
ncbi:hypothetical protein JCM1840_004820 [Sporobolomyces johnsonii]